jgi:hypothetical protein
VGLGMATNRPGKQGRPTNLCQEIEAKRLGDVTRPAGA